MKDSILSINPAYTRNAGDAAYTLRMGDHCLYAICETRPHQFATLVGTSSVTADAGTT